MSDSILIIDTVCPKPYSPKTLAKEGLGGSEATAIRVAEALGVDYYVNFVQHCRDTDEMHNASYVSPASLEGAVTFDNYAPSHILVMRNIEAIPKVADLFPKAKLYLWLQDVATTAFSSRTDILAKYKPTIVGVSQWHKTQIISSIVAQGTFTAGGPFSVVYNPIDDLLEPNRTPVDRNKLVFMSAPIKGLDYTIEVFKEAVKLAPDLKLYVANPGYYMSDLEKHPNIIDLGVLKHSDVINHMRDALCLFYPNHTFAETFGIVMAEANAVGCPVLAHPFGAAPEVLRNHPGQLVDCKDINQLLNRLISWHNGDRPVVRAFSEFRLKKVVREWKRLLGLKGSTAPSTGSSSTNLFNPSSRSEITGESTVLTSS